MHKITRYSLLNYISKNFVTEKIINPARIFNYNNKPIKKGFVVYLCERELRVKDNFALNFAYQKSKELNLPLKIIYKKINYEYLPKQNFTDKQINQTISQYREAGFDFCIIEGDIFEYLKQTALLIIDFNPISNRQLFYSLPFRVIEIDGHNIIPARFITDKQEYSAMTMRRKVYLNIENFLTDFENVIDTKVEADYILEDFIAAKLPNYAEYKNNPAKNALSGLSKYINLGFISSQRIAIEVVKSNVSDINKEVFLEELIIRKELADNFCLYCKDFKSLSCVPSWAKNSLFEHKNDFRKIVYTLSDFENSKTHDKLWNAAQNQLKREGVIHGYLRMYWAKKILEWTKIPNQALEFTIYLNDKYSYDSPSPNGYTGILWALGALHDRPFQDWFVTGMVRRMTYDSIKRKYDIDAYISHFL